MRQTFHIFAKDVRRCWMYVAVTLLALAVVIITDQKTAAFTFAPFVAKFALVISWWFAIAAVVHAESPTGDRQFWVTRPYSWKSLLSAKVLFIVLMLMPPLALSDALILAQCGFPALSLTPDILKHVLLMTILCMAPALCLAILTKGMRQFAVTMLAMTLILFAWIYFLTEFGSAANFETIALSANRRTSLGRFIAHLRPLLPVLGFALLLLWQYARRRTGHARTTAVALLALWFGIPSIKPPNAWALSPEHSSDAYPDVTASTVPELKPDFSWPFHEPHQFALPFRFAGRDAALLDYDWISIAIFPQEGQSWHTGWHINATRNDKGNMWAIFDLDDRAYRQLTAAPVRIRAVFGVAIYQPKRIAQFPCDEQWHSIPEIGQARVSSIMYGQILEVRAPFNEPEGKVVYWAGSMSAIDRNDNSFTSWNQPFSSYLSPIDYRGGIISHTAQSTIPNNESIFLQIERRVAVVRRDVEMSNVMLSDYMLRDR